MSDFSFGSAFAVTPSDTEVFAPTLGLYVGTGGDVEVQMLDGRTCVFPDIQSGSFMPVNCTKVLAANTTASGIVRGYER
jgi:hypothetical protein